MHRISYVLPAGFQVMALATQAVFEFASRHPLEVVARETGFRNRRHLREAFMRSFGKPPQSLRRDARLGS